MIKWCGTTRPKIGQSLPIHPNTFPLGEQTEARRRQDKQEQETVEQIEQAAAVKMKKEAAESSKEKKQYRKTALQKLQLKRSTTTKVWDQQERKEGVAEEERRESDIKVQIITQKATMLMETINGESIHSPPPAGVTGPQDKTPSTIQLNPNNNFNLKSKILQHYGSWIRNYTEEKKQEILTAVSKKMNMKANNNRVDELKQSTVTSITSEGNLGNLHYSTQKQHGERQGLPNNSYNQRNNTRTTTTKNGTHKDTTTTNTRNKNYTTRNSNSTEKSTTNKVQKSTETGEYVTLTTNEKKNGRVLNTTKTNDALTQSPRHTIQRDTQFTTRVHTGLQGSANSTKKNTETPQHRTTAVQETKQMENTDIQNMTESTTTSTSMKEQQGTHRLQRRIPGRRQKNPTGNIHSEKAAELCGEMK